MRVRILNHNAYGTVGYFNVNYVSQFPVGSIHEVKFFWPDTGEVELGDEDEEFTFDPSEYEVVEE